MPDEQDGGQGGQGDEGQGGNQPDNQDDFELGTERRSRYLGTTRQAAPESDEAPAEPGGSQTRPDPDDRDDFELVDLTEEERRGPR
jgi:hypothetical protein